MQKRSHKKKKWLDVNELASTVAKEAMESKPEPEEPKSEDEGKNPAAIALGRLGGLKSGKACAKKLTSKQRSEAARKAALARWKRVKEGE
jgi:hypothetical protein